MDREATCEIPRKSSYARLSTASLLLFTTYIAMPYTQDKDIQKPICSLTDIRNLKMGLRKQINEKENTISSLWHDLFHKEEIEPHTKAQKMTKLLSLGAGAFDGVMLGWKLYRKFKSGSALFSKKHR